MIPTKFILEFSLKITEFNKIKLGKQKQWTVPFDTNTFLCKIDFLYEIENSFLNSCKTSGFYEIAEFK
jgi:hypothetical protein